MRVLSLVPSATDWLVALGLGATLVGATHECEPPSDAGPVPVVVRPRFAVDHADPAGIDAAVSAHAEEGVYELDVERVARLAPDVIVTQELCDVCAVPSSTAGRAAAACRGARVLNMSGTTLRGVLDDGLALASALGVPERGERVVAQLRVRLQAVADAVAGAPRPSVAFVEWPDPLWSAGHWVPDQIAAAGGYAVAGVAGQPSQRATAGAFAGADVVVVGPCGFNLDDAELAAGRVTALVPDVAVVWAVDANRCFSRPAPGLVDGVEALAGILHPGRWSGSRGGGAARVVVVPAQASVR